MGKGAMSPAHPPSLPASLFPNLSSLHSFPIVKPRPAGLSLTLTTWLRVLFPRRGIGLQSFTAYALYDTSRVQRGFIQPTQRTALLSPTPEAKNRSPVKMTSVILIYREHGRQPPNPFCFFSSLLFQSPRSRPTPGTTSDRATP